MKIEIVKTGINGEGIGYYRRKPVFVVGALEGETVDLESIKDNGKYYTGKLKKITEKSDRRVRPFCKHQKYCGGCSLMITEYENQLKIKKENLRETLQKYAGYKGKIEEIIPSEKILNYRNKINLPFSERDGVLFNAMYAPNSNHPVIIERCLIHDEKLEIVRLEVLRILNDNHLKLYDNKEKSGLRQLVIRGFEKVQIVIVSGNDVFSQKLIDQIMQIEDVVSLYQCINTVRNPVNMMNDDLKLLAGENTISLKLGEYTMDMLPRAFFQLNRYQAEVIYKMVAQLIPEKIATIVEAYSGIGAISMYVHDKADKVYGIELESQAVENAIRNAERNGIGNVFFICGDAGKKMISLSKKQKIDILIVDPPRSGLDFAMIDIIRKSKPEQIIYVSCNPATLAKNIHDLSGSYHIRNVVPVDMFPQTVHVETVVLMSRIHD